MRINQRYNKDLDQVIDQLTPMDDLTNEVPIKDILLAFPYLSKGELILLNFSQLKKAKRAWEELFQQRLDSSQFSKQQLCIWRLFQHIINADSKSATTILEEKISQDIIGSNPFFFQAVVRTIKPLNKANLSILSRILKTHVLTEDLKFSFTKKELKSMIKLVSNGGKLKEVIPLTFLSRKTKITKENWFSQFLETGKLTMDTIDDLNDCYTFLKMARNFQDKDGVVEWLEAYLSSKIHELLENQDFSILTNLKLESEALRLKLDQYFLEKWTKDPLPLSSEEFETLYVSAKEHELVLLTQRMKEDYMNFVNAIKIDPLFDTEELSKKMNDLSNQIERLFEDDYQEKIIQILLEKVDAFFKEFPGSMEEVLNQAKKDNNQLLVNRIHQIYKRNPENFDMYFLSPPQGNPLEEIILHSLQLDETEILSI